MRQRALTQEESTSWDRLAALLIAVASICYFAWLLLRSQASPFLGDYSEWTYHGVLLRDWLRGVPDQAYLLKNYPVPNSLTTMGLGVLMLFMPWSIAAKLWLIVEAVLGLLSAILLQRASGIMQGWRVVLVTVAVLFGSAFWFGFENFLFGTYFAMLLCALLMRGVQSRWLYSGLLVLAFFSHMIPFGFALLALGLYAWQERQWSLAWQALPSLLLTIWYFAGRVLHGNADGDAGMVASVPYLTPLFAVFKVNTFLKCWGFVNPAGSETDSILLRLLGAKIFMLLFLLNLTIAVAAFAMMAVAAWRSIRAKTQAQFFWTTAVIFFVVSLALPGAAAGISDPGGRMMQVTVWCGICLVATQRRWVGLVLAGCALVLLSTDCYLISEVAMQPPMLGEEAGPLPARLRQFVHVYYSNRAGDYDSIKAGKMDLDIYPTAMFLEKKAVK